MPDFEIHQNARLAILTEVRFAVGGQTGSLYMVPPDSEQAEGRPAAIIIVGKGGLEGREGMRQYLDLTDHILPPGSKITITT
jgi:hypothetical protein